MWPDDGSSFVVTTAEIIRPLAGFVVLSLAALAVIVALLRGVEHAPHG